MLGGRLQKLALRLPLQRVGKLNSKALPESCTGYLSQSRLEPGTWTLLGTRAWEKYPLWRGEASTGYMWQDKAGPLYTLTPGTLPSTLPSLTWAFVPQPPGAPSSNWPASLAACQLLVLAQPARAAAARPPPSSPVSALPEGTHRRTLPCHPVWPGGQQRSPQAPSNSPLTPCEPLGTWVVFPWPWGSTSSMELFNP